MAKKQAAVPENGAASLVFPCAAGLFFLLVIVKLANPIILDSKVEAPQDLGEAFNYSWPPTWGAWMFVPVALAGLFVIQWDKVKFHWILALPLVWLGWELIAATGTVRQELSRLTVLHFAICVGLFFLGYLCRKGMANPWPIWAGMGLALCWGMRAGMEQHFGGLEATRKMIAAAPEQYGLDPRHLAESEYWKRLNDDRIFGTFGNPNTLAGAIVLLLPLTLAFIWRMTPKVRRPVRILFVLILGGCALECLYWSRSKAGWLVALVVGLVALGHSGLALKWRRRLIYGVLIAGLAGFGVRYASYFHKEHNSLDARFTYWHAALVTFDRHPLFGTGPGTFQIPYQEIKRPADEMARLCHNDYLEQASDSGIVGFLSYLGMVLALLVVLYRYRPSNAGLKWPYFTVWLGVFGVCLHSAVDFHLYIPALAWPMYFLCGWLLSRYINDNVA